MIELNPSITIGNIIEIGAIIGGGFIFLIRQSDIIKNIKEDMIQMQDEIKQIAKILIQNAILEQRILNVEEDVRLLRGGKGYITEEVSGEYTRHGKVHSISDKSDK